MANFDDDAPVRWCNPNPFPKDNEKWQRTEIVRKLIGKKPMMTVAAISTAAAGHAAFAGRDPRSTLATLKGLRVIKIEGAKVRATKGEMELRYAELSAIVEEQQPATVRGIYYQATVSGLVPKTENGYDKVQDALVKMRRCETDYDIPYEWIVDNTRREQRPYTCTGISDALEDTVRQYRRTLWTRQDPVVQVWLEKDALAGVIEPITNKYDVPLMVSRGFSSITFLYDGAAQLRRGTTAYIYHLGDSDSYGIRAGEKIHEELSEHAPDVELHFRRLAVTDEQIAKWNLATRFDKKTGEDTAVELDAIAPNELRRLVEDALKKHMPPKKYKALMAQEEEERQKLRDIIDQITDEQDLDDE